MIFFPEPKVALTKDLVLVKFNSMNLFNINLVHFFSWWELDESFLAVNDPKLEDELKIVDMKLPRVSIFHDGVQKNIHPILYRRQGHFTHSVH